MASQQQGQISAARELENKEHLRGRGGKLLLAIVRVELALVLAAATVIGLQSQVEVKSACVHAE